MKRASWIRFWISLAVAIVVIGGISIYVYREYEDFKGRFGCDGEIELEPGEIVEIDDQLVIAQPEVGKIVEELLENQRAIKLLKSDLEIAIEYAMELELLIGEDGGKVVVDKVTGELKIQVEGEFESGAGEYVGEVDVEVEVVDGKIVPGKVSHRFEVQIYPVHAQVYIARDKKVSISCLEDWAKLNVTKVQWEPAPWWTNFKASVYGGGRWYEDEFAPEIGGGLGYDSWMVLVKYSTKGKAIGIQWTLSLD